MLSIPPSWVQQTPAPPADMHLHTRYKHGTQTRLQQLTSSPSSTAASTSHQLLPHRVVRQVAATPAAALPHQPPYLGCCCTSATHAARTGAASATIGKQQPGQQAVRCVMAVLASWWHVPVSSVHPTSAICLGLVIAWVEQRTATPWHPRALNQAASHKTRPSGALPLLPLQRLAIHRVSPPPPCFAAHFAKELALPGLPAP
jgi:hypothetical protein